MPCHAIPYIHTRMVDLSTETVSNVPILAELMVQYLRRIVHLAVPLKAAAVAQQ